MYIRKLKIHTYIWEDVRRGIISRHCGARRAGFVTMSGVEGCHFGQIGSIVIKVLLRSWEATVPEGVDEV